jgi:membrane protein
VTEAESGADIFGRLRRGVLFETGEEFLEDRALRLGAGLAYYGVVTMAPLLVLLVGLAGLVVGEQAQTGQLGQSLTNALGTDVAQFIQDAVVSLNSTGSFASLTLFSLVALIFTASVLFVAWKDALNMIWHVEYRGGVRETVQKRLFAFAVVGGLGVLLVAVIVAEMVLAMIDGFLSSDAVIDTALRVAGSVVPLILGALLLGMIFRFGPDVEVPWRAIWPGTLLTTVLLLVVAWGYGVYIDTFANTSAAGVASSAMLLIVLVYFVAQIFMFGAEFIKVLARRRDPDLVAPS